MKTSTLNRISDFLRYALLTAALLYLAVYLWVVFFRIPYPFQLEWMEGGSLDHVKRILSGQKLYVSPSLEFVPYVYTPLYYYLSAPLAKVLGVGFMPLRLVSFLSSLGCLLIIFLMVQRETSSRFFALTAVGLFSATFRAGGAWLDIARADSLFLFLVLAALYLIKFKTSLKSYIRAGMLISLAFLTKQNALIIALPLMLYVLGENRRGFLFFTGTVVTILSISTWGLNFLHDGWYRYYIFHLPRQHTIVKAQLVYFWINDMISPLFIAGCMSLGYLYSRWSPETKPDYPPSPDRWAQLPSSAAELAKRFTPQGLFYPLAGVGMIGSAWLGRLNFGGYNNVLLPAYAFISILFGLSLHAALEFTRRALIEGAPAKFRFLEDPHKSKLTEICIYLNCIIQFVILIYNPWAQIPTIHDLKAGKELVQAIKTIKGEVLIPYHNYLSVMAGKNGYAHAAAISDVLGDFGGQEEAVRLKFSDEIRQAIKEKRFAAIIIDADDSNLTWLLRDIKPYYIKLQPIFNNEKVFWTVTGMLTRPQFLYIPNKTREKG